MGDKSKILVVDDERGVRQAFSMVLKDDYEVILAETAGEAFDLFTKNAIDAILLDIMLPDASGIDLLKRIKGVDPAVEIIMVTAVKEIQTAVTAIKLGAYEYVIKPFVVEDVLTIIERALEKRSLVQELTYLRSELKRYHLFEKMVGQDEKMSAVFDLIATIAESDGTALIQGESGTGKELVARAIHNRSPRKEHPFVVINCAAIPATLMESEIFGHTKGAFTGATNTTMGKLEIAHKGTVFLDDVDNLDVSMQAKLLRIIQEREFERIGSTKIIKVDIRFVAATNKDLTQLISKGDFREDLYYRLNVFPIKLPPLRERRGDIPLLINHFLELNSKKSGKTPKRFSKSAMLALMKYEWPGNVRELHNLVERVSTVTRGQLIQPADISLPNTGFTKISGMTLKDAVSAFEKEYISEVLENAGGSRKEAAGLLGIHRNTLLFKINELGIKL